MKNRKNVQTLKKTGLVCMLLAAMVMTAVPAQAAKSTVQSTSETQESKTDSRAEEILKTMTLKEKVGQMFLTEVPLKTAKKDIKKYQYGGVLLLKNSFSGKSKKKVKKMLKSYQKVSKIKMLTAVDEEGGTVVRASAFRALRKTPFQSPRNVFAAGGWKKIKSDAKEKAVFLKSLGLNTNLAPVADLPNSKSSYIYKRSFSDNPKKTARFVRTVVGQFEKQKVVSTLKHFPGYGGNADTHTSVVVDKRKLKTLKKRDLVPFQEGIGAGVPMIMVKHTVVTALDAEFPASLSEKVHRYLRDTMGFDGVIITDSITMDAPQKWVGNDGEVAVLAVLAGNDLICTNDAPAEYQAVLKAVKSGRIPESRIDEAVTRVLKMKLEKGIIS